MCIQKVEKLRVAVSDIIFSIHGVIGNDIDSIKAYKEILFLFITQFIRQKIADYDAAERFDHILFIKRNGLVIAGRDYLMACYIDKASALNNIRSILRNDVSVWIDRMIIMRNTVVITAYTVTVAFETVVIIVAAIEAVIIAGNSGTVSSEPGIIKNDIFIFLLIGICVYFVFTKEAFVSFFGFFHGCSPYIIILYCY